MVFPVSVRSLLAGLTLLLFGLVYTAGPAHAQTAPYGLKTDQKQSTRNAFSFAKSTTSVSEDFTLTNSVGDSLFVVTDDGKVFIGSPGTYLGDTFDENFFSRMTRPSGNAGVFWTMNEGNGSINLYARHNGPGIAGYFAQRNDTTRSAAVLAQTTSMGAAGGFEIYNSLNDYSSVFGLTQGLGPSGNFNIRNPSNGSPAVWGKTDGTGAAGEFSTTGSGNGLRVNVDNTAHNTDAFYVSTNGTGQAGAFDVLNGNNGSPALGVFTQGTGNALRLSIDNSANGSPVIWAQTNGTGMGADVGTMGTGRGLNVYRIDADGTGDEGQAIYSYQAGTGGGIVSQHAGASGSAGWFFTDVATNQWPAIGGVTKGAASAGEFVVDNASNTAAAVWGKTNGTGAAGTFEVQNTNSTTPALVAVTEGTGDIVHFNAGSDVRMRVANNGDVFADGTFTGGGADVAEAFEVEGAVEAYEPGDVLVVSTTRDRTVTRSGAAYSTRVVGVYATKPGVLLSEKGLQTNWSERVPMGVMGVLPTKVTLEGGPIQRGDLLVTSSTSGHAMKADLGQIGFGQVLGKALQPYDGTGPALIEVMVSVK